MNRASCVKVGDVFNRLTVLKYVGIDKNFDRLWLFKCECGVEKVIKASLVKRGKTKSCGCLSTEVRVKRFTTHNRSRTTEYQIWNAMKERVRNPNCNNYYKYGARGITMCERWMNSFENFLEDMGERPSKKHTIDRTNNDGNYEPENCKWVLWEQQSTNKRTTRKFEIDGEILIMRDVEKKYGISHGTFRYHLKTKSITEIIEFYKNKRNDKGENNKG